MGATGPGRRVAMPSSTSLWQILENFEASTSVDDVETRIMPRLKLYATPLEPSRELPDR